MSKNPQLQVLENLPAFFEARGFAPPDADDLDAENFRSGLQIAGFRSVSAERDGKSLVFAIVNPDSKYAQQKSGLISLIAQSQRTAPSAEGEIIVAVPPAVVDKTNIVSALEEARRAAGPGWVLNMYSDFIFHHNPLEAQAVPEHEVLGDAEAEEYLRVSRLERRQLRRLPATDPPIIWLGGRADQIVKVRQPSATAGEAIEYYLVGS